MGGMNVLDTHLGGGSNRISADKAGVNFWAYEIDKEYFDKQEQRFKLATAQVAMVF